MHIDTYEKNIREEKVVQIPTSIFPVIAGDFELNLRFKVL